MKAKIICIKHPKYDGKSGPILSCKACCKIYVDLIKSRNTNLSVISNTKKEIVDDKTPANK